MSLSESKSSVSNQPSREKAFLAVVSDGKNKGRKYWYGYNTSWERVFISWYDNTNKDDDEDFENTQK